MSLRGAVGRILGSLFGSSASAPSAFHPTRTCPECGTRLMRDDGPEEWRCPNLDCPAQIRARLEHWCSPAAMDIADADPALVARLVRRGLVRDAAEFYRLSLREIASLEGMDQASAKKFFDHIQESRRREAWRLLFGLGIPGLDAAQAQSLCRHFRLVDQVFAAGADRLAQAEGVDLQTARSIVNWQGDPVNRRLVKRLFKAGLNFKSDA